MRNILLIVRSSPYNGVRAREAIDAALLFSAFTENLTVLFSGDGVLQLLRDQNSTASGEKNIGAMLGAFAEYDISRVYADQACIAERGFAADDLRGDVMLVQDDALRALIAAADTVLTM